MATAAPGGLAIPAGVPSPLSLQTFAGAPGGMSRDMPQHEIADTEAWTIVDANLQDPGLIRRRGPLASTGAANATKSNRFPLGIARVQDPSGAEQQAVYARTTTPSGEVYTFGPNGAGIFVWPYTPATAPADLFCTNDALLGGAFLGSASAYDAPASKTLQLWMGASLQNATNLAVSAVAVGAATISVTSAIAQCSPGHHVFDNTTGNLVGVIKSISGSTITLVNPALATASNSATSVATAIDVKMMRGLGTRVATGRITCSTTSAVVNGGLTKFKAQGLGTGLWDLYTPQYTWIGTVTSVASDAQLTLVGNAARGLVNSDYIAIKTGGSYTTNPVGWLNAVFAGHQFYGDGNKLWFSSTLDPEAVDTTLDGDYITFSADPIRAIIPGLNVLVVVTETEAFALTGAVGTTPDRWRGERIHDDGTICGMACMPYQGGALWAGKRGIWFYDGANPVNVVGKLDNDYRLAVSTFSSAASRAYCAVANNHYLVWVQSITSGVFNIVKGASTTNITRPTFVIDLKGGTVGIWQNVEIRGGINPPDKLGLGSSLLSVQTLETAVNTSRVIVGDTLFTDSGQDAFLCNGAAVVGPDLYVETKKYSMGDGQRLKMVRMLLLHFWAAGGNIKFDTIRGLNGTGVVSNTEFWATTAYTDKRIKFNAKSQYLALRIYQSLFSGDPALLVAANTTRITLGQWALGFKWKRPGRV